MPDWWREAGGGVAIRVRLTPKGGADRIEGIRHAADGSSALAARVRAAPENGEANAALEALVAKWLGVARREVSLASGHRSRLKTLNVARSAAELRDVLNKIDKQQGEGNSA